MPNIIGHTFWRSSVETRPYFVIQNCRSLLTRVCFECFMKVLEVVFVGELERDDF